MYGRSTRPPRSRTGTPRAHGFAARALHCALHARDEIMISECTATGANAGMGDSMPAPAGGAANASGSASVDSTGERSANAERYLEQRLLGEGGMGAVYLVHDRETGE